MFTQSKHFIKKIQNVHSCRLVLFRHLILFYLLGRYLCGVWPHYDDVSGNGYQNDGEGGKEDAAGLEESFQLANNLLQVGRIKLQ